MSGGKTTKTKDDLTADALEVEGALEQLDQEMKEDASVAPASCEAGEHLGMRRGSGTETTWNFVQMNMTLLPIARPLPVNVANRLQDGFFAGKPRTPNQKLHRRVLQNASNISPRRNEDSLLRRRGSTSSESGTAASLIPRHTIMERQFSAPTSITGKRKSDHDDHYETPPWRGGPAFLSRGSWLLDQESRVRSVSEDLTTQSSLSSSIDSQLDGFMLSRSASTSSALSRSSAFFKDKRILELQDEERRLQPDERASLPSPSKRSRLQ